VVPDDVLLEGLVAANADGIGRLGSGARANLGEWRKKVRLQQVAFEMGKVLTKKWKEERGEGIPTHRLFPQMLEAATRFIEERVEPIDGREKQDVAINPYFGNAIAMIMNAMEVVDGGGKSQEVPVVAKGPAGIRSTRTVDFWTGKKADWENVKKCHLNAIVFDSEWERDAAKVLDADERVKSWVKNDRLGLVVPYRKDGGARSYLPDFLVELVNGEKLIIEIKGQLGEALVKKAAAERWCRAVTNEGSYGKWTYYLCREPKELGDVLKEHSAKSIV
jgi:type III restriction enzyme